MNKYICLNDKDNVAVALQNLASGTEIKINSMSFLLKEDILMGHKFSLKNLSKNSLVIKYGYPIGVATQNISQGTHVHTHNLSTCLKPREEYIYSPYTMRPVQSFQDNSTTFMGYLRENNIAGIRNEIWIIPTVGCVNDIANRIANMAKDKIKSIHFIDDVFALTHPYGCSQLGDDQINTQKIIAQLCSHPNVAGALLLGLGCENCNINEIGKYIQNCDNNRVKTLVVQDSKDEIAEALQLVDQLIDYAGNDYRTEVPLSKLVVGVKCGGSDGLSGITANPLVGKFSDYLINHGGSVIMTEVPEMFGAEKIIMNRCYSQPVFKRTVAMINDFKDYFLKNNHPIYENPSPGNKAGGITTLEEKSLGCTQKSGSMPIMDILDYGASIRCPGLSLLYSPGNDLVASTALAASGCHIILFTTGRGTPFASPVPTLKISSNSDLYNKKNNWIDFDAGKLLRQNTTDQLLNELCEMVIKVANGEQVKSEINGYHDMAIFKQGVTL